MGRRPDAQAFASGLPAAYCRFHSLLSFGTQNVTFLAGFTAGSFPLGCA